MIQFRWIRSFLLMPFSWGRSIPLVLPDRIEWNSSLTPRTIRIKENAIFYVVKGEGDPLLLIHGYGAGMWIWEKQIDFLSQFYRVYALDVIGHGFSERPKVPYTPETYIHFLNDFMDGVKIEKATLIGSSMGGGIAWAMAALFPERVDHLILIDSIPPDVLAKVGNESLKALVAIKNIPFLAYLIIGSRSKKSMKWVLQECVSDTELITEDVVNRQYQISKIKGTTWVLYSTIKNAKGASMLKDYLSRIHQPTLILWGEKDFLFSPTVGKELHRAIKGSKFQVIEKSGHIPMWETPNEVNQAILSFLKE